MHIIARIPPLSEELIDHQISEIVAVYKAAAVYSREIAAAHLDTHTSSQVIVESTRYFIGSSYSVAGSRCYWIWRLSRHKAYSIISIISDS